MEGAPRRHGGQVGRLAVDRGEALTAVPHPGNRLEQGPCVGMGRRVVDLPDGARFHDASRVHHGHLIAHLGHDPQVVSDENQGQPVALLQLAEEIQVLRLDRQIEARRRLVRDQEPRLAGHRDGTDDSLAHAPGHLVGIVAEPGVGRRDLHGPQQVARAAPRGGPARALVDPDRLGDLIADREERVQRGHRVLEDHGDALAADVPHLGIGFLEKVFSLESDLPADDLRRGRQEPQDGEREGRLARAGFSDDAERLAGPDGQRDLVHRSHHARATGAHVVGREIAQLEQGSGSGHRQSWRSWGSSFTRSQSPRRLAERTISMMQQPGSTVSHQ